MQQSLYVDSEALRLDIYKASPSLASVDRVEDQGKAWMLPHLAADRASSTYPNKAGLPVTATTATAVAKAAVAVAELVPAALRKQRVLVISSTQFGVATGAK